MQTQPRPKLWPTRAAGSAVTVGIRRAPLRASLWLGLRAASCRAGCLAVSGRAGEVSQRPPGGTQSQPPASPRDLYKLLDIAKHTLTVLIQANLLIGRTESSSSARCLRLARSLCAWRQLAPRTGVPFCEPPHAAPPLPPGQAQPAQRSCSGGAVCHFLWTITITLRMHIQLLRTFVTITMMVTMMGSDDGFFFEAFPPYVPFWNGECLLRRPVRAASRSRAGFGCRARSARHSAHATAGRPPLSCGAFVPAGADSRYFLGAAAHATSRELRGLPRHPARAASRAGAELAPLRARCAPSFQPQLFSVLSSYSTGLASHAAGSTPFESTAATLALATRRATRSRSH